MRVNMSLEILTLPNELLVEILSILQGLDLKSARLSCTLLANLGSQLLFPRLYFAPRKAAIHRFQDITANPYVASNVRQLIYDARLFLPSLVSFREYEGYYEDSDKCIPGCTCTLANLRP